jgi:hypothetical protein
MTKRLLLILLGIGLLCAPSAFATTASNAPCDADADMLPARKGAFRAPICRNICDTVIATDTACTEFDFDDYGGMPDVIVLERDDSVDCSDAGGPTFTFTTGPTTGGSPSFVPTTSALVLNDTTDRITIDVGGAMIDRYLFTAVSNATGCDSSPEVDVRIYLIYHR